MSRSRSTTTRKPRLIVPPIGKYKMSNDDFLEWFWSEFNSRSMSIPDYLNKRIKSIDELSIPYPTFYNTKEPLYKILYAFFDSTHAPMGFDQFFWSAYNKGVPIKQYVSIQVTRLQLLMRNFARGPRGDACYADTKTLSLYPFQLVHQLLASPYAPNQRLLICASTGAGKTCILVGIANFWLRRIYGSNKRNAIIFVSTSNALWSNFVKDSMRCPGFINTLAREQGLAATNPSDILKMGDVLKKYILPLTYVEFANFSTGKYAKYENSSLTGTIVLMDECHYLVDSFDPESLKPVYTRAPTAWRDNLKQVYDQLNTVNNPNFQGCTIVGATATPMSDSGAQFLELLKLFSDASTHPPANVYSECIQTIVEMEQEDRPQLEAIALALKRTRSLFENSLVMYLNKTSDRVLDRSVFPDMRFDNAYVDMTPSQKAATEAYLRLGEPYNEQALQKLSIMQPSQIYGERIHRVEDRHEVGGITQKFEVVREIISKVQGKVLVYVNNKRDGLEAMFRYLRACKYEPTKTAEKLPAFPANRFMTMGSFPESSEFRPFGISSERHIPLALSKFNHKSNINGELIKVLLYSSQYIEGVDLSGVQTIVLLQDPGSQGAYNQLVGRGVRNCSHRYLKLDKWNVRIIHVYTREPNSPDQLILKRRLASKLIFDNIMNIAQKLAVDSVVMTG